MSEKENRFRYSSLFLLSIIFLVLNHLAACIMFSISLSEYETKSNKLPTMFTVMNEKCTIEAMRPFYSLSAYNNYINYLYWAISVSSSGA